MRFLFRWAFRLFLIAVVLIVALVLLKDAILKSIAERGLRVRTGLDVRIGNLEAGLIRPVVTLENLKIYNRAEFGGSPFVDIPELHLECDAAALVSQKLRFKLVRFHLSEMNVVESGAGQTNWTGLATAIEKLSDTNQSPRIAGPFEFGGIDVLNLTLGKAKFTSLRQPAKNTEVQLGLKNEIITNVHSLAELSTTILNVLLNRGINFVALPPPSDPRQPR